MSRSCSELVKEQDTPRTSDIELPLFYGVEVGRDGLDELGRELHRRNIHEYLQRLEEVQEIPYYVTQGVTDSYGHVPRP